MPHVVPDPYATLGVRRGSTTREIGKAYRRLARKHHPDVATDQRAAARMRAINAAWNLLRDPTRRASYDARPAVAAPVPPTAGHWSAPRRRAARAHEGPLRGYGRTWGPVGASRSSDAPRGSFADTGLAAALAGLVILVFAFAAIFAGQAARAAALG